MSQDKPTKAARPFLSCREYAELLGVSERRVRALAGRVEGAYQAGRNWIFPANSIDPRKQRKNGGKNKSKKV